MESSPTQSPTISAEAAARAAIDRSVRWPVLFFFAGAGLWLLASILAGITANLKLLDPDLWPSLTFLSYPCVQAVHIDMLVYGWGFNMAFGVMIWLLARICRVEAGGPFAFIVAGKVWNIMVALGVVTVLAGKGSGVEWMEFPRWAWPVMFLAYATIAGKLFAMFLRRTVKETFISAWYILTAMFAFPWLLLTAWIFIFAAPGAAVGGAAVNQWFISGLLFLFFIPVGLASTYYFLPKVSGQPMYSYGLSLAGFWGIIGLGGWTGMQRLVGGPLPSWMPAVSGAAVMVAILPIGLIFLNHKRTMDAAGSSVEHSPTLRFCYTAVKGLLLFGVIGAVLATLTWVKISNFTQTFNGYAYAGLLGFFSMAMIGAMIFITPRLAGCEWPSGKSLNKLFWAATYGILTLIGVSLVGGIAQGDTIYNPDASWSMVVSIIRPYATGRVLAFAFLFFANMHFIRNMIVMALRKGREPGLPTLLNEGVAPAVSPH